MSNHNILRLFFLCVCVFLAVLLSLQLYYALIDEENAVVSFSEQSDGGVGSNSKINDGDELENNQDGVSMKDEIVEEWTEEENEPRHFNYGVDQDPYNEHGTNDPYKYAQDNDIPIIMWWTHFTSGNSIHKCSQGECFITENRTVQNDERTRAFLFYGTDFDANDLPLPRKNDHEWGLFHEESPKNNAIIFHEDTIVLFNHTATFRRHSDYPLTTQCLESIDVLERKPMYTLEEKTTEKGQASVLYVQSGCNPPSDRDAYVQEFMKHINVDSFGKCLNNKELPEKYKDSLTFEDKGFYKIVGKYKFTLAFENAICDDYITEKLWRPLEVGSVPIYRGSPSVLDWMPNNHSIILVDDFSDPKALAEFIKTIDTANHYVYLKYLEFKKKGGVINQKLLEHMEHRAWSTTDESPSFVNGFECFVCDRLHENLKRQKNGLPIIKHVANQDHFGCPRPVLFDYAPLKNTEQFERDMWVAEYDAYAPVAKTMNKVVLSGDKHFKYDRDTKDIF